MDARSEANFQGVHSDLVKVITRASEIGPREFIVIHGLRTLATEKQMVANGASETLHSRHLPNQKGFACAVDVAALDQGHVTWNTVCYSQIWTQVQKAASELDIPVEWGGNWTTLKDFGHFQLPWADYP